MNPDTNRFENLQFQVTTDTSSLLRPDGSPVPTHWSIFQVGENYIINNYTFRCAYIGETSILFEPVKPAVMKPESTYPFIEDSSLLPKFDVDAPMPAVKEPRKP